MLIKQEKEHLNHNDQELFCWMPNESLRNKREAIKESLSRNYRIHVGYSKNDRFERYIEDSIINIVEEYEKEFVKLNEKWKSLNTNVRISEPLSKPNRV